MRNVEVQAPDRFCDKWVAVVLHRSGAEVQSRNFDNEAEAVTQARAWQAEADRTGHLPGCPFASYER